MNTVRPNAEGVIELDAAGRYVGANDVALEILGVTLDELLASTPDRFAVEPADPEAQAALESQWERDGRAPVVGTTPLRRADGRVIRVTYGIAPTEDGFEARIRPADAAPSDAPTLYTVGDVLRQWRAAERRLAELTPASTDWSDAQAEIEMLRRLYQDLFAGARGADASG